MVEIGANLAIVLVALLITIYKIAERYFESRRPRD